MIIELKKRALHRSKILQGQLRGLEKMIDQEEYCMDIITQSLAIQKSLASLNKLIVENHIKTHVADKLASKDENKKEEAIGELLDIYKLDNKHSR
ncbi:MAG: metal-sensitive transcriptional regulator [bacterium]|nr:metal-sensitive transcriptional regulator [bacterium]